MAYCLICGSLLVLYIAGSPSDSDQVHEIQYTQTLRGHEAIFRCRENPYVAPSRTKEKCAQCMHAPD